MVEAIKVGVSYMVGARRDDIQSRIYNVLLGTWKKEKVWALKDVSFRACRGEVLGIIGANGSGKTTLCRVLAGLLHPDNGSVSVRGNVSALLSLGTGFNHQLSGEENIFLNGLMLGLSKNRIKDLLPKIVEFSELEQFIGRPLKTYSNGMRSRLGFSIAAMIEAEILIIDEALSVGDLAFCEKAGNKMREIVSNAKLVLVVTHQMSFVEQYCTRVLWLEKGRVQAEGPAHDVVSLYCDTVPALDKTKKPLKLGETGIQAGGSPVVVTRDVSVQFRVVDKRQPRDNFPTGKLFPRKKRPFWALRGINLVVAEGEILGLIGRNGAGKTTLCRVVSGILKEDRGQVWVDGEITTLFSLGAGFNAELTGRDNIYLNGMILGIPKKRLIHLCPEIIEFSGIKEFIDEPMKHYSDGMRSRLGFSIAAMINPDIFIIDEVLSVGDLSFQEKASAKIQELIFDATTVIVVTHNMDFVKKVCTRAIWLDKGMIKFDGNPKQIVESYRQQVDRVK